MKLQAMQAVESVDDLVYGVALAPGTGVPAVDGKPCKLSISEAVVQAAGADLVARLEAGEEIPVKLMHPDLGGLSMGFARVERAEVRGSEVWVACRIHEALQPFLDDESRRQIAALGMSMQAATRLEEGEDGLHITECRIEGVDLVDVGAFPGTGVRSKPRNVFARLFRRERGLLPPGVTVQEAEAGAPVYGDEGILGHVVLARDSMDDIEVPEDLGEDDAKAYLAAYREAIDSGASKTEAHEKGLAAVGEGEVKAESEEDEMPEENEGAVKAQKQELAAVQAAQQRVEAQNRELAAKVQAMELEREARIQAQDVDDAIGTGRAAPGEREVLVKARAAMGAEDFQAMIAARRQVLPLGERGIVPDPVARVQAQRMESAERLVHRLGVDGVFASGAQTASVEVRRVLAQHYPEDPRVQALEVS